MKNKKSVLRTIGTVIAYVIILAIVASLAFVLISNLSGNTVFIAGSTTMWVKTDSMEPTIPARSYVIVKQTKVEDVKVGDVIVFVSDDPVLGGAYNMHRVVEIVNGGAEFVTRGDHNLANDEYTAKADKVIGIYVRNLPILSRFGRFYSTPAGLVITLTVILGIIMAVYVPDLVKLSRQKDDEADQKKREKIEQLIREEVERLKAENNKTDTDPDKKD